MKRILSAVLAVLLLISCLVPAFAAEEESAVPSTKYPTVYIHGQGNALYAKDENGQEKQIYDLDIDTDALLEQINTLHKPFAKGVTTGDWDDWCDAFCDIVCPIFEPVALGPGGWPKDHSYAHTENPTKNRVNSDGTYNIDAYDFCYDWRLDPCDVASKLRPYIEQLKKTTGAEKVNLVGRCIGANVVLAYLYQYGYSGINDVILYCCSFEGFELAGRCFTGKLNLDSDALYRFVEEALQDKQTEDEDLYGLLLDLVYFLYLGGTVGSATWTVQQVYDQVYQNVVPRILRSSFGTMPSFWSLVPNEYLEEAEEFIIGEDTDEYAALLFRINRYRDTVYNRTDEIIANARENGTDVYIIAKYGYQMMPITEDTTIQSDSYLELTSASYGATCTPISSTFDDAYLTAAEANGTAKYISPDKQVDASSCFLPDQTWFIKNLSHMDMPDSINTLFAALINHENGMTVFDDPELPQFLNYDGTTDTISPLTPTEDTDKKPGFFEKIGTFFRHIGSLFKHLFSLLRTYLNKDKTEPPVTE